VRDVQSSALQRGKTKGCGCRQAERVSLPEGVAARNDLFGRYRAGAKKRGLEFSLTREQFDTLVVQSCTYCKTPPSTVLRYKMKNTSILYNGIDRRDNRIGYTAENCAPCCEICNKWKLTMTEQAFLEHARKVAR
jgi:hypothetical protein